MEAVKRPYTVQEEIWSSLIHGIGIALSLAGLIVLVTLAAQNGNVWVVVSTAIFGVSMVVLYTASTLYHAIPNPEIKLKLKKFDHISIYYLIAGTYTPFMLVNMRGSVGWTVFGIIWGLALIGTVLKLCTQGSGTKAWSIGLYLLMGWLVVFASKQLAARLPVPAESVCWFYRNCGNGLYRVCAVHREEIVRQLEFAASRSLKSRQYTHAVWHFFVLSGTVMHFFAVLYSCVLR